MTVTGFPLYVVLFIYVQGYNWQPLQETKVTNPNELIAAKRQCDTDFNNLRAKNISSSCKINLRSIK